MDVFPALAKAPIVEAVVDIDVEMRPGFVLGNVRERLAQAYLESYPVVKEREFDALRLHKRAGVPGTVSSSAGLESLMFYQSDEKQLIQARRQGFSFNRLAPYADFDQYQLEVETRWGQFSEIVDPERVRSVRMRFINKIEIPLTDGKVDLDNYLKVGPRAPDENEFDFTDFSSRTVMMERGTGVQVVLSVASRPPTRYHLPVILDIESLVHCDCAPRDLALATYLATLRATKNRAFFKSLGDECLALFN